MSLLETQIWVITAKIDTLTLLDSQAHEATRGIRAEQATQNQKLDQHTELHGQHTEQLRLLKRRVDRLDRRLAWQSEQFTEISIALVHQNEQSNRHATMLASHDRTLERHTEILDRHTELLNQHTDLLEQILARLPAPGLPGERD